MRLLARGFHHILVMANIGAVLATVLTYAASYISPEEFWYLFFLTYAALPLMVVHLVFVGWWTTRRNRIAFLSLLTLVFTYGLNNRLVQFSFASKSDDQLTVVSYNIGNFVENGRDSKNVTKTKKDISLFISEILPDIVCFQEYSSHARGRGDFTDFLLDSLGYKSGYFEKIRDLRHEGFSGMAIFSRYPIIDKRFVPFKSTRTTNALIYADVVIGSDTVRVMNVHLQTNRLGHAEYETVTGLAENTPETRRGILKVMGKLRDAAKERTIQTYLVEEQILRSPYPIILCGDFNDLPSSFAYRKVRGELQDSFIKKGNGIGNTYAGVFPSFRIDHVFASESFEFLSHRVHKVKNSDHYPIVSTLRKKSPEN